MVLARGWKCCTKGHIAVVLGLLGLQVASTMTAHPHLLAYSSVWAGGRDRAYLQLADSTADVEGLLALYTRDARWVTPGRPPLEGRDALGERYREIFAEFEQTVVLEVDDNPRYPYKPHIPLTVAINPVVEPLDDETFLNNEGCLSVPLRGDVERQVNVRVRWRDRDGYEHDEIHVARLIWGDFCEETSLESVIAPGVPALGVIEIVNRLMSRQESVETLARRWGLEAADVGFWFQKVAETLGVVHFDERYPLMESPLRALPDDEAERLRPSIEIPVWEEPGGDGGSVGSEQ